IAAAKSNGEVALALTPSGETKPLNYLAYKFTVSDSAISGDKKIEYTNEPMTITIPQQTTLKVVKSVKTPAAYIVPAQWTHVIDVLRAHNLKLMTTTKPWESEVEVYRCPQPNFAPQPFEGRHTVAFGKTPMGDAGYAKPTNENASCTPTR